MLLMMSSRDLYGKREEAGLVKREIGMRGDLVKHQQVHDAIPQESMRQKKWLPLVEATGE